MSKRDELVALVDEMLWPVLIWSDGKRTEDGAPDETAGQIVDAILTALRSPDAAMSAAARRSTGHNNVDPTFTAMIDALIAQKRA